MTCFSNCFRDGIILEDKDELLLRKKELLHMIFGELMCSTLYPYSFAYSKVLIVTRSNPDNQVRKYLIKNLVKRVSEKCRKRVPKNPNFAIKWKSKKFGKKWHFELFIRDIRKHGCRWLMKVVLVKVLSSLFQTIEYRSWMNAKPKSYNVFTPVFAYPVRMTPALFTYPVGNSIKSIGDVD